MEKDRIVKKDVSQQEVIDFFQQLSRTGFLLALFNNLRFKSTE